MIVLSPHRIPGPLTGPMLFQIPLLNQLAQMQFDGIVIGGKK